MTIRMFSKRALALMVSVILLITMLPAVAGADTYKYVKTSAGQAVNVHSTNVLTNANVIGTVPYGGKVTVVRSDKTWSYIRYGKTKGYVLTRLLSGGKTTAATTTSKTTKETSYTAYAKTDNGRSLNIRSSRKTHSGNVIGQVPYGGKVTVTRDYGTWAYITYGKIKGYAVKSMLSKTKPGSTVSLTTTTRIVTSADGRGVNFRSTAEKHKSNVITVLPVGTKVKVVGLHGSWSKVEYGGRTGYMLSVYLK